MHYIEIRFVIGPENILFAGTLFCWEIVQAGAVNRVKFVVVCIIYILYIQSAALFISAPRLNAVNHKVKLRAIHHMISTRFLFFCNIILWFNYQITFFGGFHAELQVLPFIVTLSKAFKLTTI